MKPQQVPNMQHYPSMAPGGHYPRQQYPVGQYPAQAPPQPLVQGSFDPGARFGAGATVNVPVRPKIPYLEPITDSTGTGELYGQD